MSAIVMRVELSPDVERKRAILAEETGRSLDDLAGEAIDRYVDCELKAIEGIRRGLDDMRSGRVVSNDDAMREIREVIKRARRGP